MVKIRLTRGGAKKRPFYHIIVTDSRSARDGRNIERVGFYNPVADRRREARRARTSSACKHWVGQGAQMTDKVADARQAGGQGRTGRLSFALAPAARPRPMRGRRPA